AVLVFLQNHPDPDPGAAETPAPGPALPRLKGVRLSGGPGRRQGRLATHAVTRAALDQARVGQGPTLIEAYTYRMGAHTTSDDPTRYRIASEVEAWQAKDPILRIRRFLSQQGIAGEDFFSEVDEQARVEAVRLRERVLEM